MEQIKALSSGFITHCVGFIMFDNTCGGIVGEDDGIIRCSEH